MGAYSGEQLHRIEGFDYVIIGAGAQGLHLVKGGGVGAQHDDRNISLFPDPPAHLHSVHSLHIDIQDNEIHRLIIERECILAVSGAQGLEIIELHIFFQHSHDTLVVIYNQYLFHGYIPL